MVREGYYPGRAVACRTFDPHYRSETVEEIPPSSEGVAFKPATWCLLGRVYRTKDMGPHHVNPRVNGAPKFFAPAKIVKEQRPIPSRPFPVFLLKGIVHQVRGISSKVCENNLSEI